jgi:two-component system heavy metal sensor histidine kinase CusS
MFLKTAAKNKRAPHNPWSITKRLALIYSISTFLMLVIATFSLYWVLVKNLDYENYEFLHYKTEMLRKILQTKNNKVMLEDEIYNEPSVYHYYARIVDQKGRVIIETRDMAEHVPLAEFPHEANEPNLYATKTWHSYSLGKYFLLSSIRVPLMGHPNQYQVIQVARNVSTQRQILISYRRAIMIVLVLGIIVSAWIGIVVTRRGLYPLRAITRSANQITISALSGRLDPWEWPKELFDLATAFNQMMDGIEAGFNRLSQFSGDLAHELRTPVNNIMSTVEIVLTRARTLDEYKDALASVFEEFERLSRMIDSLLFLARAENPAAALVYSEFSVREVMSDLCEFYEGVAESKQVKLTFQGDAVVNADVSMLRRALTNLVSNALHHTPAGGEVVLLARMVDSQVEISVSDTGIGIAREHLPNLFDRFYRVDSARAQQTGGTGLGLAIIKYIMELHKGRVAIVSELGKGTTVTLIFP